MGTAPEMQRFFSLKQLNSERNLEARLQAKLTAIRAGSTINAVTQFLMSRRPRFFGCSNLKFVVRERYHDPQPRPSTERF
jgi:hypothetical protein